MSKLATNVDQAPVEQIAIDQIAIGPRTREKPGSVVELKRSIDDLGLMHPILVTDAQALCEAFGTKYKLIAGERRMRAVGLLRRKIPARVISEVGDVQTLMEMERDENEQRSDLYAFEKSKARWDEVKAENQRMIAEQNQIDTEGRSAAPLDPNERKKRDKQIEATAMKKVYGPRIVKGKEKGASRVAYTDRKVIKIVEDYPELESWSQRNLFAAYEALEEADPDERKNLRAFLATVTPRAGAEGAKAIRNLIDRWPADLRKQLYRTMRDRPGDALSSALGVPPIPDERLVRLGVIIDDLAKLMKEFNKRDEAQNMMVRGRKHLEQARDVLRAAYEERRNEFESMLIGE